MGANVHDSLKELSVEETKDYCQRNSINAAVAMVHIFGDFNLGTLIRTANFVGFKEVFYIGGKKSIDRRSTVGTHHYTPLTFFKTDEEFINTMADKKYQLVCVENNVPQFAHKTISIYSDDVFTGLKTPVFLFGEEGAGLDEKWLDVCERIVTIPAMGSVRSLNVGACSAIITAFYSKYRTN